MRRVGRIRPWTAGSLRRRVQAARITGFRAKHKQGAVLGLGTCAYLCACFLCGKLKDTAQTFIRQYGTLGEGEGEGERAGRLYNECVADTQKFIYTVCYSSSLQNFFYDCINFVYFC